MRVLFLTPVYPWPLDTGWAHRYHHIAQSLARRHELTLVSEDDVPPDRERSPLEAGGVRAIVVPRRRVVRSGLRGLLSRALGVLLPTPRSLKYFWSRDVVRVLRRLREEERFDVVWASRIWMAEMARAAGFGRIVVDVDDVPSAIARRRLEATAPRFANLLRRLDLLKLERYERSLPRRFWRVIYSKPGDLPADEASRKRTFVIPNAVVPAPVLNDKESQDEILFVGHLFHQPNVDAIGFFRSGILPRIRAERPDVRFVIVGKGANPAVLAWHDHEGIRVQPSVPDLEPCYESATVVVVPIRQGSGTRIKVLEALARGKAVVSTTMGAEGIDLRPGTDLEIADDAPSFAAACVRLLADASRRRELGLSGRERVRERYSWTAVEASIAAVLEPESPPPPQPLATSGTRG